MAKAFERINDIFFEHSELNIVVWWRLMTNDHFVFMRIGMCLFRSRPPSPSLIAEDAIALKREEIFRRMTVFEAFCCVDTFFSGMWIVLYKTIFGWKIDSIRFLSCWTYEAASLS